MTYMAFHSYSSIKSKDHIPADPAPACLNPAPGRRYWKIVFSSTRGASYNTGIVRFSMTQSLPLICAIFPATHTRYAKKSSSCFLHTFHNLCDVGSMWKTGGIMHIFSSICPGIYLFYRMKFVENCFSVSGYGTPAFLPASKQRIIQIIFFARLRIVCIPSSSFGASSAVSPCTIFQ